MKTIQFDKIIYEFEPEDEDHRISDISLLRSGWSADLVKLIKPYLGEEGKDKK